MLVFCRKPTESIFISDSIVVTILRIRGNHVHIGIEAPMGVPVHRREVYEKIAGRRHVAATVGGSGTAGGL